ncbi:MAG: CHAT domain-containing protein [Pyrinomonadaceae bacterium]
MSARVDLAAASDSEGATALLSFYVSRDETFVFWLDADSAVPEVVRVSVGQAELEQAAAVMGRLFAPERINYRRPHYTADMSWLEPLGQRLLNPVAERLESCGRLVIAPHGELHALPLHMLAPTGGAPLGTTHSVAYVANLSLYALLIGRHVAGKREVAELPSLCLATAAHEDPAMVHESFALTPRSYAERTGGLFLQGCDATPQALKRYAEETDSVYLSCHGCFNDQDSLKSALLLSDGRRLPSKTEANGWLHELSVRDILGTRIRARLVILDACMSGIQHFSPGDEPMGFPTSFLLAGAEAVIASNWVVEQNCARAFMLALQDHWAGGPVTLGEAMRHAYTAIRAEHPHPFHWAPFSLFGNDRLTFY